MDIRIEYKEFIKDSQNDIVTIKVGMVGYQSDGTKVYDESFMWNPPWDKRIPRSEYPRPDRAAREKWKDESDRIACQLLDEKYESWESGIRNSRDYDIHRSKAELKILEEVQEIKSIVPEASAS